MPSSRLKNQLPEPRTTADLHDLRGIDPAINEFCRGVVEEMRLLAPETKDITPLNRLEFSQIHAVLQSCGDALRFTLAVAETDFNRRRGFSKALRGIAEAATPGVKGPPFSGIFKLLRASAKTERPERGDFGGLTERLEKIEKRMKFLHRHLVTAGKTFRLPSDTLAILEAIENSRVKETGVDQKEFRRRILECDGISLEAFDFLIQANHSEDGMTLQSTLMEDLGVLMTPEALRADIETPAFYRRERGKASYSTVPFDHLHFRRDNTFNGQLTIVPEILSKLAAELSSVIGDYLDILENPNEVLWGGKIAEGLQNFGVHLVLLREEVLNLRDSIRYARSLANGVTLRQAEPEAEPPTQSEANFKALQPPGITES